VIDESVGSGGRTGDAEAADVGDTGDDAT